MDTDRVTQAGEEEKATEAAREALKKLATSDYAVEVGAASKFVSDTLGIDVDIVSHLEQKIKQFEQRKANLLDSYAQLAVKRAHSSEDCLYVLHGWGSQGKENSTLSPDYLRQLMPEAHLKTEGGFYLRWQGLGIAINPGNSFLQQFQAEGLHIQDIDCILVTHPSVQYWQDVQRLYDLNAQFNSVRPQEQLHVIRYYLQEQAYRQLSPVLKPLYKQERHNVHHLELFVDSPTVEKVELSPGVALHYFLAPATKVQGVHGEEKIAPACLGLRLELMKGELSPGLSLGYLSGMPWSKHLGDLLGKCDVLMVGFGNTSAEDYGKVRYNTDDLGYLGTYSLMEEIAPRLLLCCEFGGREGDIRLDVVKKMRQEYAYGRHQGTVILPGDSGFVLDLRSLHARCSVTRRFVDPSQLKVANTKEIFGQLLYLSSSSVA